jgi:hypothetical protein
MSLATVLKEMETNRPQAEMDVTLGSPNTYGGRVGLKRAATETMKRLKLQYRNELMESAVFIVVTGSDRDNFTRLASADTFECFSTDPEEFYRDLASRIDSSLFGRENVKNLFNIAGNVLEDKALELDIGSYNMLRFSEKYNSAVNNVEDFIPLIRDAINDQVGPEIVGINAINSVVDKAIAKNHSATTTPIVLNTADERFALDLYKNLPELVKRGAMGQKEYDNKKKGKAFLVIAGKTTKSLRSTEGAVSVKLVSEESVGEALTAIRSKIL